MNQILFTLVWPVSHWAQQLPVTPTPTPKPIGYPTPTLAPLPTPTPTSVEQLSQTVTQSLNEEIPKVIELTLEFLGRIAFSLWQALVGLAGELSYVEWLVVMGAGFLLVVLWLLKRL